MTQEDIKRLCWIAWRNGSVGTGDSVQLDQLAFIEWWRNDATFLIDHLPVEPNPNYDEKIDE